VAIGEFVTLLVLFVLSGFFSGSETALTSISMARVEALVSEGRTGSRSLQRLKSNTNRMLISILIGNNLVNIGASAMATVIATKIFGHFGPGYAVGVLTLIILIFGEITPKTFAARYAGRISLAVAPPLLFFTWLVLPFVWLLDRLTVFLQGLTKVRIEPTVTASELVYMAEHGAEEGTIEPNEKQIIERIFAFEDLRARDVMIPRHQVFTLDGDVTISEALPTILEKPHSRIPLSVEKPEGEPTEITRVVFLKEILKAIVQGSVEKPLKEVAHESPLYAPLNEPITRLFPVLRENKERLVVVVDEYGALEGIVTLEDMLEELVGEIQDEMDKPERQLRGVKSGELLVEGTAELRLVEDFLQVELSGKPTDSVNLWILNHIEHIPCTGERYDIDGVCVLVENASKRRIKEVRVMRTDTAASQIAETAGSTPDSKTKEVPAVGERDEAGGAKD
jgi:CBS domain containing-hemolysin-like protein